jgi:hypothetical protein
MGRREGRCSLGSRLLVLPRQSIPRLSVNCIVGYKTPQHPFQSNERTVYPANTVAQHQEDGVDSSEKKHRGGDDENVLHDEAMDEEGDGEEDSGRYSQGSVGNVAVDDTGGN